MNDVKIPTPAPHRFPTGTRELDRILGSGLSGLEKQGMVQGSLILLMGPAAIGKTTLAMQVACMLATAMEDPLQVLYVSTDDNLSSTRSRIQRMIESLLDPATISSDLDKPTTLSNLTLLQTLDIPTTSSPDDESFAVFAPSDFQKAVDSFMTADPHSGLDLLILDHLPRGPKAAEIFQALHALSRRRGISMIVLCQEIGDLHLYFEMIRQADVVLRLDVPAKEQTGYMLEGALQPFRPGHRTLIATKNRYGHTAETAQGLMELRPEGFSSEDNPIRQVKRSSG